MGPFARHKPLLAAAFCCAVLATAATAHAQMFQFQVSFGSAAHSNGKVGDAEGIATDSSGRAYLADTTAARFALYDNAAQRTQFVGTLGAGTMVSPTGTAIDDRDHI